MQKENTQNAKLIIDRVKNAHSIDSDTKLADFLDVSPSTISTWKRRNTIDYALIFAKCKKLSANYLLYGELPIRRSEINEATAPHAAKSELKKPSEIWPDDPVLVEYERRIDEIANTIEHGPFSQGLKIRLVESLLRIVGEELDEHRKQYRPNREEKKKQKSDEIVEKKP